MRDLDILFTRTEDDDDAIVIGNLQEGPLDQGLGLMPINVAGVRPARQRSEQK